MERSRTPIAAVVFDLGEVLASPGDLFEVLAAASASEVRALTGAYWRFRDDHDRGASAEEFWTQVLSALGADVSEKAVEDLTRLDAGAWTTLRPDAAVLLRELSARGVRVGILSNAPAELAAVARESDWAGYVTDWFFSGELRMAKPDRAIFESVAAGLGLPASELLFFDDRQVNVDGARAAGWIAELWTSGERTRDVIASFGLLD
jgi:putative hydrolase of the HAD superfamily